jgi:predicted glycoside hydrolase/deacetylase ChbG (UPF0249 family)
MNVRRIWLCADDYGMSPGINTAVRDLVVRGRLNAASAMAVAPSCHRAEALSLSVLNSATPRVAIGLHVTLTAPFAPANKSFGPVNDGAFMPLTATIRYAVLRRFDRDALVAEIRSQVDKFSQLFGRKPDFIDGHQHVHLLPQIRDAVLSVAKDTVPGAWVRQCGRAIPLPARLADGKGFFLDVLSSNFRRRATGIGVRTNPAFAGTYEFVEGADFSALFPRFLEGLPDGGVVMCHPGFVDAELQQLDPLTTLREREYAFFAGDDFPAMLAARGFSLH